MRGAPRGAAQRAVITAPAAADLQPVTLELPAAQLTVEALFAAVNKKWSSHALAGLACGGASLVDVDTRAPLATVVHANNSGVFECVAVLRNAGKTEASWEADDMDDDGLDLDDDLAADDVDQGATTLSARVRDTLTFMRGG